MATDKVDLPWMSPEMMNRPTWELKPNDPMLLCIYATHHDYLTDKPMISLFVGVVMTYQNKTTNAARVKYI